MARIDIHDLPVDEELTRRESKELFGGGEPLAHDFRSTGTPDLGGTYTLNYSDLHFTMKVNKASPKLFL